MDAKKLFEDFKVYIENRSFDDFMKDVNAYKSSQPIKTVDEAIATINYLSYENPELSDAWAIVCKFYGVE